MHGYLAPGALLTAIFAAIWLNRRDYSTLQGDMDHRFDEGNRQFGEVNRRLGLIEADQEQFYAVTGKLDGRLDEIGKR